MEYEILNQAIEANNKAAYEVMSKRGKRIFFPRKGIMSQSIEAKKTNLNASIGMAYHNSGEIMSLSSIKNKIRLPANQVFPYIASFGRKDLREKWKSMILEKNPSIKGRITLPVVTNALTHALSAAGFLFLDDGDTVLVPDLFWVNYRFIIENTYGAKLETFNTFKDGGFDIDSLEKKLVMDKQVILLNFPNNPTGYTPTEEESEKFAQIILNAAKKGRKIVVFCDDAYFGLVYETGIFKESIFAKLVDLHPNVIAAKIDGATKEDYAWGLRVGFLTIGYKGMDQASAEAFESKIGGVIRATISNVSHLSQSLVFNAFSDSDYKLEKQKKFEDLKTRYGAVVKSVSNSKYKPYFEPLPYNSGYFMCIRLKKHDPDVIRQKLIKKFDTGVIALGNVLRIAYSAIPLNRIDELFENIYHACEGNIIESNR